jgi:hypothetical protein
MYKIIEIIYFNEKGEPGDPRYYIKELKPIIPFLGWKRWVYIKETKCGYGDCYKTPISWSTVEDAQEFINNILYPGILREKTQTKEIKTVNCND